MESFPVRFKIVLLLLLTALLLLVGVLNLHKRLFVPVPSDGAVWIEAQGWLEAIRVEVAGGGIEPGDRLLAINGEPIGGLREYTEMLYRLEPGGEASYLIERVKGQAPLSLSVKIQGGRLFSALDFYRALLAFIYLGAGAYILLRAWGGERAVHFYNICLLFYVLYLFKYHPKLDPLDYLVYWCQSIALLLLPALFLHFCLCFPVKKELAGWRVPIYLIYLPFALLLLAHIRWYAGGLSDLGLPRDYQTRLLIDKVHIAYFSIFFALGAFSLAHSYLSAQQPVLRQQMKWIINGTVVGLAPFVLFYVFPFLFGLTPNRYMEASILALALVPLSFGYAILRYKLMDVDIIFKQGLAYLAASTTLLGIYFLLIVLGGKLGELLAPEAGFLPIAVSALVTAFLFAPLRNQVQARIDRLFYRGEYDYRRSLIEFGKTLGSEISLEKLSQTIVERIGKTFGVRTIAILLREEAGEDLYNITWAVGLNGAGERLRVPAALLNAYEPNQADKQAQEELAVLGLSHFQPLVVRGRIIGLLALGSKARGESLSSEDLELLEALSGYVAIALENAYLYKSVEARAYEYAQLKAYSENIIESINVGVIAVDLAGRITSCNSAFEELYGLGRQQVIGRKLEEVFSGDFLSSVKKALGGDWKVSETQNLYRLYLDTRGERPGAIVNLSVSPFMDRSGRTTGMLMVLDDVTERVRLEDQLLQAEKLSSIGLLAAGIAHEINTPIAGISSYTQMLLKQMRDDDPKRELLAKIERQTFRASEIVNSLLNFSRLGNSDHGPVNLNEVITESLSLLEHQFKAKRIKVSLRLDQSLPQISGNAGKLQQVFINLFLNARDAMPNGGRLEVATSSNSDMVIVDVKDTGVGIPAENIGRIYDPFFTTKEPGKGTGLGLAVSYGIVQEHSGRIFVESEPGRGTHFRLKFPARMD